MQFIQKVFVVISISCMIVHSAFANYGDRPEIQAMADRLAEQGLDRNAVIQTMRNAKYLKSVIEAITRPAERKKWKDYRPIFMKASRVDSAKKFYQTHKETLHRAERQLGVPTSVIMAIIGVETNYGKNKGSFKALDALSTLGLDYPRRAKFFLGELESLFLLGQAENLDPRALTGSYAGALGFGQFIPSSYLAYGVDFDQDGRRDLIDNPIDAIGSVANYLARHGWDNRVGIATPVTNAKYFVPKMEAQIEIKYSVEKLMKTGVDGFPETWRSLKVGVLGLHGDRGDEFWAVTNNFYVITRYNRSPLYAMAVTQLASEIESALGI